MLCDEILSLTRERRVFQETRMEFISPKPHETWNGAAKLSANTKDLKQA